jgi:hypothetical protein
MSKEPLHGDCRPHYDETAPECAKCWQVVRCIEESIGQGRNVKLYSAADLHESFIRQIKTFLPCVEITEYPEGKGGVEHRFSKFEGVKPTVTLKTQFPDMKMMLCTQRDAGVMLSPFKNMSEVHQTISLVREKAEI